MGASCLSWTVFLDAQQELTSNTRVQLVFSALWLSGDTFMLFIVWQWRMGNKTCCLTPDPSNSPLQWSHQIPFMLAGGKCRQNRWIRGISRWGTSSTRTAAGQPLIYEHSMGFFQDFLCIPPSRRAWSHPQLICRLQTSLLVWNCNGIWSTWANRIPTPNQEWKWTALPLAFTDQANGAAGSLKSLQPRDEDACPHSKELCSVAFIRYLCRGLAL